MRRMPRAILFVLISLLLCSCNGLQGLTVSATPTAAILADSFFFGCAYLDSNKNGEIETDDQGLHDARFVVTFNWGGQFAAATAQDGCATIVVPGGLDEDSWPVTTNMEPPAESGYDLASPAEVVLEYPESHADFLFTEPRPGE